MDLYQIIDEAITLNASDIHITVDLSPVARINGKFKKLSNELLTNNDVYNLVNQITDESLMNKIKEYGDVDFSVSLPNRHRARVNIYKQKNNYAMALRIIPNNNPHIKKVQLAPCHIPVNNHTIKIFLICLYLPSLLPPSGI